MARQIQRNVHRSNRYIASGSSTFSPSGNAVVGVAGETSTSTDR
ncbi:glutamyl-tRNA(Gln) amidotransferase subunit A domain protein [Mycobacterium kansasii 662]|uniref:Glutamyl-tRNA(Gln) amidotransferase subunit A domain protein n=1 Tax=Mycobacterium kansasii 662 TaxID=1299326 RepID=X7XTF9_MYCKA|nr:glutamyl-tRNA(Gln) amidotransferase subunit A domain protein [Mycobacterium kansasii 662]